VTFVDCRLKTYVNRHGCRKNFFQGGPLKEFSKIFQEGGKSGEIYFSLSKIRKQPFLLKFSKSRGLWPPCPPAPLPTLMGLGPLITDHFWIIVDNTFSMSLDRLSKIYEMLNNTNIYS